METQKSTNRDVVVCIPTRHDRNEVGTLPYPLMCLALQTYQDFTINIRDEGHRDAYADRQFRLVVNLLAMKGIHLNYRRTLERRGAGFARRSLFESIHNAAYILWLDDDMIIESNALSRLLEIIESDPKIGFVQGTKRELDPFRSYHNDINRVSHTIETAEPVQIWFGDSAFLLMRTEALHQIDWDIITRYQLDGLTGEDVSMSLMVAQHYQGRGAPDARGWHLSPRRERWLWEPASDALQVELLRGKVDPDIISRAIPHMAPFVDAPHKDVGSENSEEFISDIDDVQPLPEHEAQKMNTKEERR